MRITGGALRGRLLSDSKSDATRPMRDQVRAAIFNTLNDLVAGSRFLDLFAGTGSVGLEALSRGAAHATFVDKDPEALRIIRANLKELQLEERARVLPGDVFEAIAELSRSGEAFDLIFVGPPYGKGLADRAMEDLAASSLGHRDAIIFVEVFKKEALKDQYGLLKKYDARVYGDNSVIFYSREEAAQ